MSKQDQTQQQHATGGDADAHPDTQETVNRESHPNASGPEGLAGDMGVSSERRGPFDGIEGTGSQASTQGRTEGESPTVTDSPAHLGDPAREQAVEGDEGPDKPDETLPISNVDRTVGEVQPDPVANKHPFDPSKNPRH